MADLSRFLVICASTGTVLSAGSCYLVDDDSLTPTEWEEMESFSDAEMADLARHRGCKLSDTVRIRPELPGESATAQYLASMPQLFRQTLDGRRVEWDEPGEAF